MNFRITDGKVRIPRTAKFEDLVELCNSLNTLPQGTVICKHTLVQLFARFDPYGFQGEYVEFKDIPPLYDIAVKLWEYSPCDLEELVFCLPQRLWEKHQQVTSLKLKTPEYNVETILGTRWFRVSVGDFFTEKFLEEVVALLPNLEIAPSHITPLISKYSRFDLLVTIINLLPHLTSTYLEALAYSNPERVDLYRTFPNWLDCLASLPSSFVYRYLNVDEVYHMLLDSSTLLNYPLLFTNPNLIPHILYQAKIESYSQHEIARLVETISAAQAKLSSVSP